MSVQFKLSFGRECLITIDICLGDKVVMNIDPSHFGLMEHLLDWLRSQTGCSIRCDIYIILLFISWCTESFVSVPYVSLSVLGRPGT